MKTAIIYYSHTGNTKKVALALADYLKPQGEVDLIELKALDEPGIFLGQAARAIQHKRALIDPVNLGLGAYDLVCVGTPVWAFGPAPAVNTFLDKVSAIEGKTAVLFTTYGSGTGNDRCLKYIQDALEKKGVKNFKRFGVQQFDVKKVELVRDKIAKALEL